MDKIRKKIQEKGLKLLSVAKLLGISRACLWYKLSGKTEFTQSELKALSNILGCSIASLCQ